MNFQQYAEVSNFICNNDRLELFLHRALQVIALLRQFIISRLELIAEKVIFFKMYVRSNILLV